MGIDDSYDLQRQHLFGDRVGIALGGYELHLDDSASRAALESALLPSAAEALNEVPDLRVGSFTVGRSSSGWMILATVGVSAYSILKGAKSVEDGVATIRKWATRLRNWQKRLASRDHLPPLTIEALRVLVLADLYERFGMNTDPCIDLLRDDAVSARDFDGTWTFFGPVRLFVPDRKRNVTHMYTVTLQGEIVDKQELRAFELESRADGYTSRPLQLPYDPSIQTR